MKIKTILCTAVMALALTAAQAQSVFTVNLSGDQEVPTVDTPATGSGTLTLNLDDTLSYSISYSGLTGEWTANHIHGPAPVGANAGVIFGLAHESTGPGSGILVGTTPALTEAQQTQLFDQLWYVNIHSSFAPAGEIRGQIVPEPSTYAMVGLGTLLLVSFLRRRVMG